MQLFLPILCLLASTLCAEAKAPFIQASPEAAMVDQEIHIEVKGLKPQQQVELKAEAVDEHGHKWVSAATFQADQKGTLNLDEQAPIMGSYEGVDGMGLFCSLRSSAEKCISFKNKGDAIPVLITLQSEDKTAAKKEIIRLKKNPDVQRVSVKKGGLVGAFFLPYSQKPLPAIVVLNGGTGGLKEMSAQVLASHGFAALALGYFGVDGLPSNLENIPLEYFQKALAWLKTQPSVDSNRIGIYGISRGGELSLILGTLFPETIHAIAATVPSSVVFGAIGENSTPAWKWKNKPFSLSAPISLTNIDLEKGKDPLQPITLTPCFLKGMQDRGTFNAASIPVEKITCPLLLISGGDDQTWPSSLFAAQIKDRLRSKGSQISCVHFEYERAGHQIGIPYLPHTSCVFYHPVKKRWFSTGGSLKENELASRDSWKKILAFFNENLK